MVVPKTSSSRHRKGARVDKGWMVATARDLEVLSWIGEQYAACLDQVAVLLGRQAQGQTRVPGQLSLKRTSALVKRWSAAGLVRQQKILAGQLPWVWLTLAGLQQVGLVYGACTPKASRMTHLYYVNQARLFVERQYRNGQWKSERRLQTERTQRGRQRHVADGEIQLDGARIAIEVELTAKTARRLVSIFSDLAQQYDEIWYFVDEALIALLEEVVEQFDPTLRKQFTFRSLSVLSSRELDGVEGERPDSERKEAQ